MTRKQDSPKPVIEERFNQDFDREKYLNEGGILARIYLMMRSVPMVRDYAFKSTIEPLKNQKNITLFNAKLHEVSQDKEFLGALEIELLARDFRTFINTMMTYGPVRVDLIEPNKIFLSVDHIQNILADISETQKTLMAHVAAALKDNERVLSPWDILPEQESEEYDLNKISALMLVELQHPNRKVLEKMVENKISQIKDDKNINLTNITRCGIEKTSEIDKLVSEEYGDDDYDEAKKEGKTGDEYDFYSDVIEIEFEVGGIRKLLTAVMKYQASSIEITDSGKVILSREHANLLLGDVIKTGQMLSEQLQMLLSDPARKAAYDAALKENEPSCPTCKK